MWRNIDEEKILFHLSWWSKDSGLGLFLMFAYWTKRKVQSVVFMCADVAGIVAACWAALVYHGHQGYVEHTRAIINTAKKIEEGWAYMTSLSFVSFDIEEVWISIVNYQVQYIQLHHFCCHHHQALSLGQGISHLFLSAFCSQYTFQLSFTAGAIMLFVQ